MTPTPNRVHGHLKLHFTCVCVSHTHILRNILKFGGSSVQWSPFSTDHASAPLWIWAGKKTFLRHNKHNLNYTVLLRVIRQHTLTLFWPVQRFPGHIIVMKDSSGGIIFSPVWHNLIRVVWWKRKKKKRRAKIKSTQHICNIATGTIKVKNKDITVSSNSYQVSRSITSGEIYLQQF